MARKMPQPPLPSPSDMGAGRKAGLPLWALGSRGGRCHGVTRPEWSRSYDPKRSQGQQAQDQAAAWKQTMSLALSHALEPESKDSGKPVLPEGGGAGGQEILGPQCPRSRLRRARVWWRVERQEGLAPQTRLPDLPGLWGSGVPAWWLTMKERC